jgi:hypothetical protein
MIHTYTTTLPLPLSDIHLVSVTVTHTTGLDTRFLSYLGDCQCSLTLHKKGHATPASVRLQARLNF